MSGLSYRESINCNDLGFIENPSTPGQMIVLKKCTTADTDKHLDERNTFLGADIYILIITVVSLLS